jgi:DNA-binding response OmpR family regulator
MEEEQYRQMVQKFGVEAYVEKPYDAQKLIAEIRKILKDAVLK